MINEMKFALKKMNINIYDVINVAKTKPFGFMAFYPGPGVGGHCIPIDPLYFSWKSKQFGYNPKFIELASKVNINVTNNISKQILKIVRKNNKKNKKILILGVSYKKNIEDTRESASLKIFQYLHSNKIRVEFYDPYVKSEYLILDKSKKKIFSINLNYINLKKYSHVIIATDHDILNYDKIYRNSKLIIDLRKRYKDSKKIISI
jgi:UDP-N-acetyl-D-glucosamine dehydrogenase